MLIDSLTISEVRSHFKQTCDDICDNHIPLRIQRKGEDVVIMSASDYSAMAETLTLLTNRKMANMIDESIMQLENGKGIEREPTKD